MRNVCNWINESEHFLESVFFYMIKIKHSFKQFYLYNINKSIFFC